LISKKLKIYFCFNLNFKILSISVYFPLKQNKGKKISKPRKKNRDIIEKVKHAYIVPLYI